jgi:ABC-type Zn uptake system ZnuABC Zn-binding protein ZnuA
MSFLSPGCGVRRGRPWLLGVFAVVLGVAAAAPVKVVTTIPDLADWVRSVGGTRVEVRSLLRGIENPHTYEPGPDDARLVSQARLLVRVGMGLEEWLDGLVENAGNKKLRMLTVADGIDAIKDEGEAEHEKQEARSQSAEVHGPAPGVHVHHFGNPHIWLDPENAKAACARIAAELGRIDPAGAETFLANAGKYSRRLDSLTRVLQEIVKELPDRRFISYHEAWPHFARRFGFDVVASIEPLPGQEPSAKYLAGLVKRVRQESVRVVVTEPQLPRDLPEALAREAGIRLVTLAPLTGSLPEVATYAGLLEYNVRALVQALRQ